MLLTIPLKDCAAKVEKFIPCNCQNCRKAANPQFFEHKDLLRRKQNNRLQVECPESYKQVAVLELLDGTSAGVPLNWERQPEKEIPDGPPSVTPTGLETVRLFLASSEEMREKRDSLDLYLRRQNDILLEKGLYLQVIRWESFFGALSKTRSQDEYNRAVRQSDMFICLFRTKMGKFTEEEFDVARQQFMKTGKPHIYIFFNDVTVNLGNIKQEEMQSLWAFQKKLKDFGHFCTTYKYPPELNLLFREQLDLWLQEHNRPQRKPARRNKG